MSWQMIAVEHAQWVLAAPPPDGPPQPPPGIAGFANQAVGWLKWVLSACALAGVLAGAILIAIGRRNRNDTAINGFVGVGYAVLALGVGATAGAVVSAIQL